MNKAELAAEVATRVDGADADARRYVDAVFEVIMQRVTAGERVQIIGFGTFDSVERAARIGRNPRTGAAIQVPASTSPRFHAGQTFRSQVSDGRVAAEPPAPSEAPAGKDGKPAKAAKTAKTKDVAASGKVKKAKATEKKAAKPAQAEAKTRSAKAPTQKPAKAAKTAKTAKPAKTAKTAKAAKDSKAGKTGKAGKK